MHDIVLILKANKAKSWCRYVMKKVILLNLYMKFLKAYPSFNYIH